MPTLAQKRAIALRLGITPEAFDAYVARERAKKHKPRAGKQTPPAPTHRGYYEPTDIIGVAIIAETAPQSIAERITDEARISWRGVIASAAEHCASVGIDVWRIRARAVVHGDSIAEALEHFETKHAKRKKRK